MNGWLRPVLVAAIIALPACGAYAPRAGTAPSSSPTQSSLAPTPTPAPKPSLPPAVGPEAWIATPYDPRHPPPIPGTVADPAVPWCTTALATLSWDGAPFAGSAQSVWARAVATNHGAGACAIEGAPAVSITGIDGR